MTGPVENPLRVLFVLLLVAGAASVPASVAESGTFFVRHIERLVGTPTPLGPITFLSDRVSWHIELGPATVVWIEAESAAHSTFHLSSSCSTTSVLLPSTHEGRLCSKPGRWRVDVDPAAGVAVNITVTFRGHVGDLRGAPSAFTLTPAAADRACVVPGVCLP